MSEIGKADVTDIVRSWWGLVMPVVTYVVSDMGLPKTDETWWVPWALSVASFVSYVVGRFNGVRHGELDEVERLRLELDAVRAVSNKHEIEAMKWKTMYTTRENTMFEMRMNEANAKKRELLG